MEILLKYNFNIDDVNDYDFQKLYSEKRRDSIFAVVYRRKNKIYALRDHLGIVPLYYRIINNEPKFSLCLIDLINENDPVTNEGKTFLLGTGTPRLRTIIDEIKIVPPGTVLEIDHMGNKKEIYRYKMKPKKLPKKWRYSKYVEYFGFLINEAIERTINEKKVGVYFSGGVDSMLITHLLKKKGIDVTGYTFVSSSHKNKIEKIKKIGKRLDLDKHEIYKIKISDHEHIYKKIIDIYGIPHCSPATIGIAGLWLYNNIENENNIYLGQNSDTAFCAVGHQSKLFFRYFLPKKLRKRFLYEYKGGKYQLPSYNILDDYMFIKGRGLLNNLKNNYISYDSSLTNLQKLTLTGMFFAHTPHDSEEFLQPAFKKNIKVSGPFYDIDVIEFLLSIPLRYRVSIKLSRKTLFHIKISKKILIDYMQLLGFQKAELIKTHVNVSLRDKSEESYILKVIPDVTFGVFSESLEQRMIYSIYNDLKKRFKLSDPFY